MENKISENFENFLKGLLILVQNGASGFLPEDCVICIFDSAQIKLIPEQIKELENLGWKLDSDAGSWAYRSCND